MDARAIEIKLGDVVFTASPFNIGEIEDAAEAMDMLRSDGIKQRIIAARVLILIAMRQTKPEMTPEQVRKIVCAPQELFAAIQKIMIASGYVKEPPAGKAESAA